MTQYETSGISNGDVEVTIKTEGPENQAEKVHMHGHEAIVRALQAFDEQKHPDECDGLPFSVAWDRVLEE